MPSNFNDIEFLNKFLTKDYNSFLKLPPFPPFSDEVIDYLNALSKNINKDPRTRDYPDLATFSFYCRRGNISKLKKKILVQKTIKLGRGLVFHITPSNVPVNFAFSLIIGLLSGNSNIVRLPSKNFDQIKIIIDSINKLSHKSKYSNISKRIVLVRYDYKTDYTKRFSEDCNVRVIWGGDDTIANVRSISLKPKSFDITFPDRYSMCLLNADKFIVEPSPDKIISGFYNDTFLFDQNACTSPHLIIWTGSNGNVIRAKKVFWNKLYEIVKNKYNIEPITAINKLTTFYNQVIEMKSVHLESKKDNFIWRINLNELENDIDRFTCNSGYFSEYHTSSIANVSKIINTKFQTLSYYGFSAKEMEEFIVKMKPLGIDRIVPIGRTMDFSLIWDGYNLIDILSRNIEII